MEVAFRTPTVDELRTGLDDAIAKLERVESGSSLDLDATKTDAIVSGLHATALALSASIGECHAQTPYAPLRPVLQSDGVLKWCCNHPSEHCEIR